jgi:hypothetical protein
VAVGLQLAVNVEARPDGTLAGLAVSVQTGALGAAMPAPLTAKALGLAASLLAMLIELVLVCTAEGVKVTFKVQLADAAKEAQLWVTAKTLPMLLVIPLIVRVALPELVRVTDRAALVAPMT